MKKCPAGKIYRVEYSRQNSNGSSVVVKGNCIRATSNSGKKTSITNNKNIAAKKRRQSRTSRKCPKGEISRISYRKKSFTNKFGTHVSSAKVPSTCIKAVGQSKITGHKGEPLFVLEKGVLSKYGYSHIASMSMSNRHKAIDKALKDIKPLSLYRRLNALYVLNKDKDPILAKLFRNDANYVKKTEKYQNRETAQ
jgi:hypothetical protein